MSSYCLYLLVFVISIRNCLSIWCYRCTSATPGCSEDFNWRGIGYLGEQCPESTDICVKVIEKRGAKQTIIRDCLSSLTFRTDIPADKYEGCRPAAVDVQLGHYVNHTIKEHDIKRDYFTNVTYCFCFLDHRCNAATTNIPSNTYSYLQILIPLITVCFSAIIWSSGNHINVYNHKSL